MPYIKIKAYPKDEQIKNRVAERINQVFLEEWGCPQEAISLSFEEVAPENWKTSVQIPEVENNADKMTILNGKKKYE
jgi:4-oxalocrotonate tautomerase